MILHIDIDSFFASVEQSLRPELRGREVLVAHPEGMVLAANYIAKSKGVRTTDLTSLALKKLSKPVLFNVRYGAYQLASQFFFFNLFSILSEYPGVKVLQISIDECFIFLENNLTIDDLKSIKSKILKLTNLPASIGAGSSKLIAKQASKKAKPFGVYIVETDDEIGFLSSFKLSDLWGFGPKTVAKLHSIAIDSVTDLLNSKQRRILGLDIQSLQTHLFDATLEVGNVGKSLSVERSKRSGFADLTSFSRSYGELVNEAAFRLEQSAKGFKNFEVRLYFADGSFISYRHKERQHTSNINLLAHLASLAKDEFEQYDLTQVRRISFTLSNLAPSSNLEMFSDYPIFEIEPPHYSLDDLLFYGLTVKHLSFGIGTVRQILDDAILVDFSGRERIIVDRNSLYYSY